VRELARVLKPAGLLVLGFREPSDAAVATFPAAVYRFRSAPESEALLASVGFVVTEMRAARVSDLRVILARAPSRACA
jgi:hypothetical protein